MFTVVIPLYNKAHTIERTLSSVLRQTFQEFEVMIVNDGSTDNGVDVIQAFTNDPRIRIIEQDNQGVSAARNRGVECSRYEYIAFLDGDDEWLPSYLQQMHYAIMRYPNAGMFCCAGFVKDENSLRLRLAKKYRGYITLINYFENPHVYTHISATIVTKYAFKKTCGFPKGMKKNEDFALLFTLALQEQVVYCGEPLSIYYGGVPGQATSSNRCDKAVLTDVINRFNLCHQVWLDTLRNNDLFLVFEKYEIRHIILGFIRRREYGLLDIFINGLSSSVSSHFSNIEKSILKNNNIRLLALMYIYFTKILWRLNRFPVTG